MNTATNKTRIERGLDKQSAAMDRIEALGEFISAHTEGVTIEQTPVTTAPHIQAEVDALINRFGNQVAQGIDQASARIAAFTGALNTPKTTPAKDSIDHVVDVEAKDISSVPVANSIPQHSG